MLKVINVVGARPNFMKVAPLVEAMGRRADEFSAAVVHTGQHYDARMSADFFRDLGLPAPDVYLGVGSGSHAQQTAAVMQRFEPVVLSERPDWVIVVGDVNSTLACALVCSKLGVPVAHVEAGLRSRDRSMPEEVNRLVTDVLADVLWTPSPDADTNLISEGVDPDRISHVGNIMIDSFELVRPAIEAAGVAEKLGLTRGGYGVVTLHRPSNVDDPYELARLVAALAKVQARLPLVFPVHPRTRARLAETRLDARLTDAGVRLVDPLSYVEFMSLVTGAAAAITDSGGVQEETTYLGIPCLTLRRNTERPITITEGTNRLVCAETLPDALRHALREPASNRRRPQLWDGRTAARCVSDLRRRSNALDASAIAAE